MAEEGKDLGPEEHSIKVFLSGNSGNKEVRIFKKNICLMIRFTNCKSPNKRKYNRPISSKILYYLFALMRTTM